MKKSLVLLFGLIIITGSIFPFSFNFYTTPLDIVKATVIESVKTCTKVPVYVPGAIGLETREYFENKYDISIALDYRFCYYTIPGCVEDLVSGSNVPEFVGSDNPNEMMLKTYIEHYKISKSDFTKAIEKEKQAYIALGYNLDSEDYELPNADIIYTFNNELINYYYRRA